MQPITGHRELSDEDAELIKKGKELANLVGEYVAELKASTGIDQRWVAIGTTDLQKGFMALERAVLKPEGF